jgi:hypothetical protein
MVATSRARKLNRLALTVDAEQLAERLSAGECIVANVRRRTLAGKWTGPGIDSTTEDAALQSVFFLLKNSPMQHDLLPSVISS